MSSPSLRFNQPRGNSEASARRALAGLSNSINQAVSEILDTASGPATGSIVYMTSNTSFATATYTKIGYDGEIRDVPGWHDNAVNNTRITVDAAGVYLVTGMVTWSAGTTTTPNYYRLLVNNSTIMEWEFPTNGAAARAGHSFSGYADVAAGDYLEISAQHGESGPLNMIGGSGKTWLMVRYLGA